MSNFGVYINGRRPTSKKAIKEAVANGQSIVLENTSMFGGQGFVVNANGTGNLTGKANFVGPDPYTSRKFYGTVEVRNGKVIVK